MNLLTKSAFAKWAGKSAPAVTKALKQGRLELFQDTGKINIGSPKSQAFKSVIGNGQKNIVPLATGKLVNSDQETEPSEDLKNEGVKVLQTQKKKINEELGLKREQRIKEQIKNAVRLGEVVSLDSVNTMIMTYLDKWLSTNKRRFNGSFDEFERMILADKPKSEIKRAWAVKFEEWQHEGNEETMKRLSEIQEVQSKG